MNTQNSFRYPHFRPFGALRRLFLHDKRGVAAIEFGIMIPVFSLMVVSVTDIGLAVYRKMQVENAAQAGAQYAIARGFNATAISSAVTSATNSSAVSASPEPVQFCGCPTSTGVDGVSCGTVCPGGATAGTYAKVSAQGSYYTLVNYQVVASTYSFTAQSIARLK
ncbi:TadE/TadG family type IV pilus assembly protein [Bradyrhizobium sp. CB3481]|uniref:TadE/TadG family type IV pilus assembly protein n=1 Tax=Bradyrhizobium sp. CB3481 TaxID=3039158 RepID=UPI0024B26C43|nr:TadE/TadG family type IV pilus assembly protein [Bradyrhizobium sp. CB3481]WFU13882.1 pilus assembly protein [Bradyrhizobium sp. CB3481]